MSNIGIVSRGNLFRGIRIPSFKISSSSEPKYRPLIARDRPKTPWRKRRRFIIPITIVIFLIAASGTYYGTNSLNPKQISTTISSTACFSLLFPSQNVAQLPESWAFSSCIAAHGDPAIGTSPEISYTITGPGVLFTVSGTVSAKYTIEVGSENYYGTFFRSYTTSLNSNDTEWSMNVPCDGYNGCVIDIFNNASSNNPVTVNFTAS